MRSISFVSSVLCLLPNIVFGSVYPQKASGDAPYSVSEAKLQAAIKLPSDFTAGEKLPIILAPGTGSTGSQTFAGNFIPLLANSSLYEGVPLDIPDYLLDDIQVNAEYVAYAINYISSIAQNSNVSIITWSQGSIDTQWALKYWPSTRTLVSDLVSISPDIAGTTIVEWTDAISGLIETAPALKQQEVPSELIATLRNTAGISPWGDSAIVPTTAVYSADDEIVQPQSGDKASGIFLEKNGVSSSNNEVQVVCPGEAAGGNFSHEGMLYNALAVALAFDALANDGPGETSRLNLTTVCAESVAPGITTAEKEETDSLIADAGANIVIYVAEGGNLSTSEPPIMAYAAADTPA